MKRDIQEMAMIFVNFVILSSWFALCQAANRRPVIGVLAQESSESEKKQGDTYFYSDYVKFVELAGAKAVPIRINEPDVYYENLFKDINGVLFPGGGVDIVSSEYARAGRKIYALAVKSNDAGDYFPLWGICLGFQLLTALTSGKNVLVTCDAEDVAMRLKAAPDFAKSRIFGNMPDDLSTIVTTWNVTANFHHFCLTPKAYKQELSLAEFYNVLTYNKDRNGLEFISTMEAKRYPFYGTQWHPEKNIFHYEAGSSINDSLGAVRVSQYIANVFINEAKKSGHQFSTKDSEAASLIDNFPFVYLGLPTLRDIYFFNYTDVDDEPDYIDTGFDWIGFHVSERCKRGLKIMLMMFVLVIVTVTMAIFLRRWLQINNQNTTYHHILSLSQRYAMLDHGMDESRLPKSTFQESSFTNAPDKISIAVPD